MVHTARTSKRLEELAASKRRVSFARDAAQSIWADVSWCADADGPAPSAAPPGLPPPPALMPQPPEPLDLDAEGGGDRRNSSRAATWSFAGRRPLPLPLLLEGLGHGSARRCSDGTSAGGAGDSCASDAAASPWRPLVDVVERLRVEVATMREEISMEVEESLQRAAQPLAAPLAAALAPLIARDHHHHHHPRRDTSKDASSKDGGHQSGTETSLPELRPRGPATPIGAAVLPPTLYGGGNFLGAPPQHDHHSFQDHVSADKLFDVTLSHPSRSAQDWQVASSNSAKLSKVGVALYRPKKQNYDCDAKFKKASRLVGLRGSKTRHAYDDMPDDEAIRRLMGRRPKNLLAEQKRRTILARFFEMGDEPRRISFLARFMSGSAYHKFVAVVILLNIAFVGYRADYAVVHFHQQTSPHILVIEALFLIFFTIEMLVGLGIHRAYYFVGRQWRSNLLELVIVVLSAANITLELLNIRQESDSLNVDQMRLLRILQVVTIFRAFRGAQVLHELRILLHSILSSLRSLGWSLIMLLMIYYMFSVFFVGAAVEVHSDSSIDEGTHEMIMQRFGTTLKALTSLFTASLGGVEWEIFADALHKAGSFYYFMFLVFIAFVILAALNVLTGVFVERAIFVDQNDYQGHAALEDKREHGLVKEFSRLFYAILLSRSKRLGGSYSTGFVEKVISREDFEEYVKNTHGARHLFGVLGLKVWDPSFFFNLLSRDCCDGQVDVETFVDVCMQLRGPATRLDLQYLLEVIETYSQAHLEADGPGSKTSSCPSKCSGM